MPKIIFEYNIKGSFELEVPSEDLVDGSLEKDRLKDYKKELKKELIYQLNGPLVRSPESAGFKAEFKITRLVPRVELEGEKNEK